MKWTLGREPTHLVGALLGLLLLAPGSCSRPDHPFRYSVVDVPISLAVGTVRTPEFLVVKHWYWILVQVEKSLPFEKMNCMMGVYSSPLDLKDCSSDDPLLRAEWVVRDGDAIVWAGSSKTTGDGMWEEKHIYKFLGGFPAQNGKKYVVEVKFTRDGTPLNVANPRLIVVKQGEE